MKHLVMAMVFLSLTQGAFADRQDAGEAPAQGEAMSEEAMMAAMAAAATPGEPHQLMAAMAGSYLAEMTFFMDASGEPQNYTMSVERTMDLGSRVMVEDWEGEIMGRPFVGHNRVGYNNVTNQYWSTWTDTWSTGLIVMRGTWDESEDAMVLIGESVHPMTGMPYTMKSITRNHGATNSTMEMYEDYGGGMVKAFSVSMTKR